MIIQFDTSAYDFFVNDESHDSRSFIDDLCSSRKLGHIALDSTKKILLGILNRNDLSQLQKAIIKNINEMITFKLSLFEKVKFRVIVFHSDNNFEHSQYDKNNIFIDLKDYYKTYTAKGINPFNKPKLVLEDINDYKVYSYICEWYKSRDSIFSEQNLSLDVEHGGGNRTANICEKYISDGKIVFSICDSDAKYPEDPKQHQTASDLTKLFYGKGKLNFLYVLKCQEVENLIPFSLLKETATRTQTPAINFIEHIIAHDPNSYLFMDLKNGFKYDLVFPIEETPYSKYWQKLFENFNCSHYKSSLTNIKEKKVPSNASIICKLSSMLPHAIEKMNGTPIDIKIEPHLIHEWEIVAEKIYSWGCAGKQLRVL